MVKNGKSSQSSYLLGDKPAYLKRLLAGIFALLLIVLITSVVLKPQNVDAATSSTLNFQARLLNSSGSLVADGTYNIEFKIFDASSSSGSSQGSCAGDANCLWVETRTGGNKVTLTNGYFSVNLASVTAFGSINWDQEMWLSMNIGGSGAPTWDGEMTPRIKLTAVPYAFKAGTALGVASNNTNAASTNSGNVSIASGNAAGSTSNSGNISIDVGTATGTAGTISVGTANTTGVTIGRTGLTTTNSGALTIAQLITGQLGITVTGATASINASSNFATNINTGSSTGTVTIGGGSAPLVIDSTNFDVSSAGAISGVTGYSQASGNFLQSGAGTFGTGTGAVSLNGDVTIAAAKYLATLKGTDFSTTGTSNDVSIPGSLIRLTGASAQTITGIAGGVDGRILTLVNAAGQSATLANNNVGSAAANRITTGTGSDLTLAAGGAITLVYDSGASLWRITSDAALSGGGANQQLSNLSGTIAINASLTPNADNTLDLGSSAFSWRTLYADTSVLSPSIDVATAGALAIGNTTATSVSICNSAACDTLTLANNADADTVTIGDSLDTIGINGATTITGTTAVVGITNINVSANNATNINTGTSTGLVTIGGGSGTFSLQTTNIDISSAGAISGVTDYSQASGNFAIQDTDYNPISYSASEPFSNLITNNNFETNTTGWSIKTSSTLTSDSTYGFYGAKALKIATAASANSGASYTVSLTNATSYNLSFYARLDTGSMTTLKFGYVNGGSDTDCSPTGNGVGDVDVDVSSNGWYRFNCTFTAGATSTAIYIKQSDATARNIFIDNVALRATATTGSSYAPNTITLDTLLNSPLVITPSENSSTALQVRDLAGNVPFSVDTVNNTVEIGYTSAGNPGYCSTFFLIFEPCDAGLKVANTSTSTTQTPFGLVVNGTQNITGDTALNSYGIFSNNTVLGTGNQTGSQYGIYSSLSINNSSTSKTITIATAIDGQLSLNSTGNTLSNAIGVNGHITVANGSITQGFGMFIQSASVTGGSLTTNYGLYVAAQNAGTGDYGIAIAAADSQTLWVCADAASTTCNSAPTAAGGIAFGSAREVQLWRGGTTTLSTNATLFTFTGASATINNSTAAAITTYAGYGGGADGTSGSLLFDPDATSVNGGAISLIAGAGNVSGNTTGGALTLSSGENGGNAATGAVVLQSAANTNSGTGGSVSILVGGAGTGANTGGALSIAAGAGGTTSGAGGALTIDAGDATAGASTGGALTIRSGDGKTTNNGGLLTVQGGVGGNTSGAVGGAVTIQGGTSGTVTTGGLTGGALTLAGGSSQSTGNSTGSVTLKSFNATAGSGATPGGNSGNIVVTVGNAGDGSGTNSNGGTAGTLTVTLGDGGDSTGTGTASAAGAFSLQGGTGGAAAGTSGAGLTAGAGAATTLNSGTGGAQSGASGSTVGGAAGTFTINGGTGGAASTSTAGTGGAGGSIVLQAGAGGAGGSSGASGAAGSISLTAGAANASGTTNVNGGAITVTTGAGRLAGTGGALTLQGGTGGATGVGGAVTIQGGTGGSTSGNGGQLNLNGGLNNAGTVRGLVVLSTAAFSTATQQNCGVNCTITQANVDSYSAVLINATAGSLIVTMPDPTITTAGKTVYVTGVDNTNDFTLRINGGGTQIDISMRENTTATLIWNGADWTAAGASSSTDLQAAYNNTLTSAGGAELVLNASGGAADGLTIRNNATTPITGALLEVQTSIGSNLLSVNNNATEYAVNGGGESTTFTAWTGTPVSGTITRDTITVATGQGSAKVVTTAAAASGVENTLSTTLTNGLKYTVSYSIRADSAYSSFSTLDTIYSYNGSDIRHCVTGTPYYNTGTASQSTTTITGSGTTWTSAMVGKTFYFADGNSAVITAFGSATSLTVDKSQTVSSQNYGIYNAGYTVGKSVWTRVTCTFYAPPNGTTITSSNSVMIRQTDATVRTYYIDNLSVNVSADVNHAVDGSVDSALGTNWTQFDADGGAGTTTLARDTSTIYDTSGSVSDITTAHVNLGMRNNLTITPFVSTQYLVTFYAKLSSGTFTDITVGFLPAGGNSTPASAQLCTDYNTQTLSTSAWTKITCIFTTPSSGITDPDVVIYQPTATARTFYVDALSVTLNTNNSSNVQVGGANKGGPVTLFTLDRSSSSPIASNNDAYLGSMYYDTTTGRIQCYEADGWGACGSAPDNVVNLNPEYAGAVLNGTGIGTMTADACGNGGGLSLNTSLCASGEARSYYKWTSPQATQQTYSIYVTYQLPATFKNFSSDDTVQLTARTDNTSNAAVTYEMFKSQSGTITQCGSGETTVVTSANTWQTVGINGNESTSCSFGTSSANAFVIFKINLKANSNANAYVGT